MFKVDYNALTPETRQRVQAFEARSKQTGKTSLRELKEIGRLIELETKSSEGRARSAAAQAGLSSPSGGIDQNAADLERIRQSIKISAPDLSEAMRAQSGALLQGQQEQARRQMLAAQARSGVRGGAAAAMAARLAMQQGQQRAQQEQDIFLRNQFMKQAADLAREQMAFQELGSRRGAMSSSFAAQEANRKK